MKKKCKDIKSYSKVNVTIFLLNWSPHVEKLKMDVLKERFSCHM